jgi:transposase
MLFPQVKANCLTGWQIYLPKIGSIPVNLHRPIPDGLAIKQVRIVRRAASWEAVITLESDVSIPEPQPHDHAIGIDLGLEKFLTTSDREFNRDHASAEVIRLRGLEQLVARDSGETKEPVAVGLPGTGGTPSRSEAKPSSRKGGRRTRNVSA